MHIRPTNVAPAMAAALVQATADMAPPPHAGAGASTSTEPVLPLRDVVLAGSFETQAVDRMLALRSYQANNRVLQSQLEMLETAVELLD